MHEAARRNDVLALGRLLDANPGLLEVEDNDHARNRPLHYACLARSVRAACFLLERGADVNPVNSVW